MKLVRRASLKISGCDYHALPVASPGGLVVSGSAVAKFDRRTFRQIWRTDVAVDLVGCLGDVLLGGSTFGAIFAELGTDASVASGYVIGISSTEGHVLWRRDAEIGGCWVVDGDLLLAQPESDTLIAVDIGTGETLRTLPRPASCLFGTQGRTGLFAPIDPEYGRPLDPFSAVDFGTGRVLWTADMLQQILARCGKPDMERLRVFSVTPNGAIFSCGSDVVCVDLSSASVRWHSMMPGGALPEQIGLGRIFGSNGGVSWLDLLTGATGHVAPWKELRGDAIVILGLYRGTVVCSGGTERLFFLDPLRGSVRAHRMPRNIADEVGEVDGLLCLPEYKRVLVMETVGERTAQR